MTKANIIHTCENKPPLKSAQKVPSWGLIPQIMYSPFPWHEQFNICNSMYSTRSKEGRSVLELKCSFHLTVFMGVRAIPFLSLMPKRFLDLAQDFVLNSTLEDHPGVEHIWSWGNLLLLRVRDNWSQCGADGKNQNTLSSTWMMAVRLCRMS